MGKKKPMARGDRYAICPKGHVPANLVARERGNGGIMEGTQTLKGSRGKRMAAIVATLALTCMAPPAWSGDQGERRQAGTCCPHASRISMLQAIANIESASGARVLNAEIDPPIKPPSLLGGPPVYGLLTVKDHDFTIYFVDVATGKVLQKRPDWFNALRLKSLAKPEHLIRARISLVQAIALTESRVGGKAVQVRTRSDDGALFYQITTLAGDRSKRVNIDAASGRLIEIPAD